MKDHAAKIRELVAELERAGWMQAGGGGKGSRRKSAYHQMIHAV
jgi:hypothetical protein